MNAVDVRGKEFKLGQRVARAAKFYKVDGLHVIICEVTKVSNGKVYLDNSPRAMQFPERLAIVS